ncbi:FAD:protein FMN transferase [Spirochaeta cellobiosiphila]|uniref:FAD:protein FMN transferase n=1 Tax=Spirochaeta cellobiosiphila TaxID=504483 RepID=UPI0009FECCDD|nr:FAD:protein FMN transferase [Spirochaeta cellobiosiphila]
MKLRPNIVLISIWIIISLLSCADQRGVSASRLLLGTTCTITADGVSQIELENTLDMVKDIENRMHTTRDGSEVALINQMAGIKAVHISNDTYAVIKKSLQMAKDSHGAFDPTLGPVIELWGISSDNPRLPSPEEIKEALKFVDYTKVVLNDNNQTVFLQEKGMVIDLGGIAKGYAADVVYKELKELGAHSALIDFGGNIMVLGAKGDRPWIIGIQDPFLPRGQSMGRLEAQDQTIVTSGIYERFLEVDGKHYHHIMDSQTGYPIDNNLAGVTVRTKVSMEADGLSTALFALGPEQSQDLLAEYPDVEAYFITKDKKVITYHANHHLLITNSEFELVER